ncbi:hypothetical protein ACP93_06930 [Xanthomonas sp. NCPPB 1128]|nr:hypothetical protein ACP93_06930 [Xanthomonas sp. NCPPB 1128]
MEADPASLARREGDANARAPAARRVGEGVFWADAARRMAESGRTLLARKTRNTECKLPTRVECRSGFSRERQREETQLRLMPPIARQGARIGAVPFEEVIGNARHG